MKYLKLLSLAALTFAALLPASRAADDTPPPPEQHEGGHRMKKMRQHRLQMLDEKLHLTAEQKTKIAAIFAKSEEQAKALRADASVAKEDRRTKMRAIMDDTHAQVRAVLTADQQKIFDTLPKDRPMGGPHGDKGGPPPDAKSE